ncbi:tryptophan halogenase family protein [Streptomyces sp. NPDC089799]|uniref:tryptophan halogenase family protein n=1 Tax=Streptomyces sp. NPDC089799 TaxID=3155066 RepID=UPI00343B9744
MGTGNHGNVVIVGGGITGWMAAAYLRVALPGRISVTLLENGSAEPRCDESTSADIRRYFDFLGLREEEWMPACGATYTMAVRFQDWNRPGQHFYHPFEEVRSAGGFPLTEWWPTSGPSGRFDRDCFVTAALCDAGKAPRRLDGGTRVSGRQDTGQIPYGYHFDGARLAGYLAAHAVRQGVRRLPGEVLEVRTDDRGGIGGVVAAGHGEIAGDLFVDCTGFPGLLLGRALGVPHVSYRDALPNDGVVGLEVPADMGARGIAPYTTATAVGAGWIRTVPLRDRFGIEYLYGSEYCSPEEAERVLRRAAGPEAAGAGARHGRLRPGRARQAWKENCVALGAAAGSVEPLASTGASFVHHALEELVAHFPEAGSEPRMRDAFNASVARVADEARDFLALHYRAAAREDTQYWRDAKTHRVPPALARRIAGWTGRAPLPEAGPAVAGPRGLTPDAYACVLLGTGGLPLRSLPGAAGADDGVARKEFAAVREDARSLAGILPTQGEYFSQMVA